MAGLLGTHSYVLDPKGRVSLPARFREAFADGCWLTIGQDNCLYVFPRAEWDRRAAEVGSPLLSDAAGRAYGRMFFGKAHEAELDSQGRVTIPGRLREEVGITKDVIVLGVMDRYAGVPPFSKPQAAHLRRWWKAAAKDPTSLMVAPVVLDVVGRKPRVRR